MQNILLKLLCVLFITGLHSSESLVNEELEIKTSFEGLVNVCSPNKILHPALAREICSSNAQRLLEKETNISELRKQHADLKRCNFLFVEFFTFVDGQVKKYMLGINSNVLPRDNASDQSSDRGLFIITKPEEMEDRSTPYEPLHFISGSRQPEEKDTDSVSTYESCESTDTGTTETSSADSDSSSVGFDASTDSDTTTISSESKGSYSVSSEDSSSSATSTESEKWRVCEEGIPRRGSPNLSEDGFMFDPTESSAEDHWIRPPVVVYSEACSKEHSNDLDVQVAAREGVNPRKYYFGRSTLSYQDAERLFTQKLDDNATDEQTALKIKHSRDSERNLWEILKIIENNLGLLEISRNAQRSFHQSLTNSSNSSRVVVNLVSDLGPCIVCSGVLPEIYDTLEKVLKAKISPSLPLRPAFYRLYTYHNRSGYKHRLEGETFCKHAYAFSRKANCELLANGEKAPIDSAEKVYVVNSLASVEEIVFAKMRESFRKLPHYGTKEGYERYLKTLQRIGDDQEDIFEPLWMVHFDHVNPVTHPFPLLNQRVLARFAEDKALENPSSYMGYVYFLKIEIKLLRALYRVIIKDLPNQTGLLEFIRKHVEIRKTFYDDVIKKTLGRNNQTWGFFHKMIKTKIFNEFSNIEENILASSSKDSAGKSLAEFVSTLIDAGCIGILNWAYKLEKEEIQKTNVRNNNTIMSSFLNSTLAVSVFQPFETLLREILAHLLQMNFSPPHELRHKHRRKNKNDRKAMRANFRNVRHHRKGAR